MALGNSQYTIFSLNKSDRALLSKRAILHVKCRFYESSVDGLAHDIRIWNKSKCWRRKEEKLISSDREFCIDNYNNSNHQMVSLLSEYENHLLTIYENILC